MPGIKELYKNLLRFDLDRETEEAMKATTPELLKHNKRQLKDGFTAHGDRFRAYRSDEYAAYKHYLNPLPGFGNPDLYVTGEFQRAWKAAVTGGQLYIWSDNRKAKKLEDKYGAENIYGLDGESILDYQRETLKPKLSEAFNKIVLLKDRL